VICQERPRRSLHQTALAFRVAIADDRVPVTVRLFLILRGVFRGRPGPPSNLAGQNLAILRLVRSHRAKHFVQSAIALCKRQTTSLATSRIKPFTPLFEIGPAVYRHRVGKPLLPTGPGETSRSAVAPSAVINSLLGASAAPNFKARSVQARLFYLHLLHERYNGSCL
jgi:hypothetical protein